ncbi:TLD domain-containing protein 1 [Seminavis robusta]|uniref:Oxidation resistance protein 1 n=1 Tax=Seminavis robusta TaxID=568900 RepID=A0A9N8ED23_9STRA|nr:TLD domain-containing protein 1 [Seminavis robusta]|eukprot:Sro998_g229540.1 TLD domain-containing protein 1 (554) ;mRNA; f:28173-29936
MGNSSSNTAQTQEQKDIKYLGDRMPFGDAELKRLYRCYYQIEQASERISFLTDWAVHADPQATDAVREERALLIGVLEAKVLPEGFGNRLYQTAFLRRGEVSVYNDNNSPKSNAAPVDEYTRVANLEQFFDGLSNCGRRGTKHAVKVLFHCCDQNATITTPDEPMIQANDLIQLGYRIALSSAFLKSSNQEEEDEQDNDMARFLPAEDKLSQQELHSFAQSIVDHSNVRRSRMGIPPLPTTQEELWVSIDDVTSWVNDEAPLFANTLSTFMYRVFNPGQPYPPSRTEFVYPVIPQESAFFEAGSSTLLFVFACLSTALSGHFHRLYTSLSDGLSFNRLQNSLLGYGGPTLLILRSADGDLFGAFTASSWRESKDFYGNSDCFLYQLLPRVAVYRPSGNGQNFMYCNSFARSRGYDKQAHGIGFGGTVTEPRLFIAEAWDSCSASSRDMTFENGPLLGQSASGGANKQFDLEALEVWGVGGEEVVNAALGDRVKARAVKDAAIQKARKVDKAAFLDDFRSGIIESKAFAHRQQVKGRADADLEDHDREERKRGF